MDYEEDFVTEEIVELKVENRIFKYKPTNAGQELSWLPLYTKVENGKQIIDNAELNKLKMRNVVGVPYSDELIRKILKIKNIEIGWKELSDNQKWELFKKLKGSMFDKIGNAIIEYDCGTKKKT